MLSPSIRSNDDLNQSVPARFRRQGAVGFVCFLLLSAAQIGSSQAQESTISYVEVAADRVEVDPDTDVEIGADGDIPEEQYPETRPDRFSDGTEDARTVYRDMGDKFDTEEMIIILPESDPELALPSPTVVPVDSYSGRESHVTPAGVIAVPQLSKEDQIFEYINEPAEPPEGGRKLPAASSRPRERLLIPVDDVETNKQPVIEIIQ